MSINNEENFAKLLNKIPIFTSLSLDAMNKIIKIMKKLEFPENKMVIQQGAEGDSMYIIKAGSVKVTRLDNDSEDEVQISVLADGDYFGELALIDNMPRSANVITIEDSTLFRLSRKDFEALLDNNIDIANCFYKNILKETTYRFRNIISKYTFTSHDLKNTSDQLDEINRDLSFAQKIQNYMINREYLDSVEIENVSLSYVYEPCIAIGGDFLNVVNIDDENIGIILADVTGHGITAALVTGVLKSAFSLVIKNKGKEPAELLKILNVHMNEVIARLFATCYYCVYNLKTKKMTLANAGHHHPFFYKASKNDMEDVECKGSGLGMIPEATFYQIEVQLEKGDKMMLFSDGIIEQINEEHVMYGKTRFKEKYAELVKSGNKDILGTLMQDLKEFSGDVPFQDDITIIHLEF